MKTQKQFESELKKTNPNIFVISKYNGAREHIRVKCKICGNEWVSNPGSLLKSKYGCPVCAANNNGKSKRKTHEQFVKDVKAINSNIIVLGKYKTAKTKILFKCKTCNNEWLNTPNGILSGLGCPVCSRKSASLKRRYTNEEFVNFLKKKHPNVVVLSKYKTIKEPIKVQCMTCGNKWKSTPSALLNSKHGCPKCAIKKVSQSQRKTHNEFVKELKKIDRNIVVIDKYINSTTPIKVRCLKCKTTWKTTPNNLLTRAGCPTCARYAYALTIRKTNKDFVEELKKINKNIIPLTKYKTSKDKIKVKCKTCGKIWEATPTNLLRGRNCPTCAIKHRADLRRKSEKEFLKQVYSVNQNIEILSPYEGDKNIVKIRCKRCNHIWKTVPSSLLRGSGCPRCSHTGTSYVEQIILLTLKELLSCEVISRDRQAIGMELDIFIPSKNIAIEYGAWPWHIGKEDRDKKKVDLCRKNKIKIIQIFDAYKGDKKNNKNTWLYKENISRKSNDKIVKSMLKRICKTLNIKYTLEDSRYEQIKKEARLNSRRMSTDRFKEKMKSINNDILILGEFYDQLTKIEVKCKKCGHQWKIIPASLLRGNGCPICRKKEMGIKMRKTNERFVKELKAKFPFIKPLNKYQTENTKMKFRCLKCGYTWVGLPKSVLKSKHGCPKCAIDQIGISQRKSHEAFVKEMKKINKNIVVLDRYINQKTSIRVKCNKCKNSWITTPTNLLTSTGCPTCAKNKQALDRRMTNEEFIKRLKIKNSKIIPTTKYVTSKTKVEVQCSVCGFKWSNFPRLLIEGQKCPKCSNNNHHKTTDYFKQELKQVNPNIIVLGEYIKAKKHIKVKCKTCGNEWESTPTNLLCAKRGCPICSRHKRVYTV